MKKFRIILSILILIVFALLLDAARHLRREKPITIFVRKNFFESSLMVSVDGCQYDFLEIIMSCLLSNLTTTFYRQIYIVRQAITNNLLSM